VSSGRLGRRGRYGPAMGLQRRTVRWHRDGNADAATIPPNPRYMPKKEAQLC